MIFFFSEDEQLQNKKIVNQCGVDRSIEFNSILKYPPFWNRIYEITTACLIKGGRVRGDNWAHLKLHLEMGWPIGPRFSNHQAFCYFLFK